MEEYMHWVRQEANQCPQVVRVEISPEVMAATTTEAESGCDPGQTRSKVSYMDKIVQKRSLPAGPDWAEPSPRRVALY